MFAIMTRRDRDNAGVHHKRTASVGWTEAPDNSAPDAPRQPQPGAAMPSNARRIPVDATLRRLVPDTKTAPPGRE